MSRISKTLVLAGMLAAAVAQADEASPAGGGVQTNNNVYVGVGLFSDMLNVNVEALTDWGNFMLRAGRFHNVGQSFSANMSWRVPLESDNGNTEGYYVGLFAGQVAEDVLGGKVYNRLGGGAEMGYHWVSEYTRTELTVGLGAAQAEENAGVKLEMAPTIFFSLNIALGY